jgi:DNA-binding CsgD family transcriptional regulator
VQSPRRLLAELIATHYSDPTDELLLSGRSSLHPLMKGWLIIERLSVGADPYLLLRRIQGHRARSDAVDSLTPREREALRHARAGGSNKEIAHKMGVVPSTVGVLLWRAARRLSATDREDLLRRAGRLHIP